MIMKREMVRVDDAVDDWAILPDRFTRVWTEPHCLACNRRVKGYPLLLSIAQRYKYA